MGNWIPNDPTLVAQILKISGSCSPPPPEGFINPVLWGNEATMAERFGAAEIAKENIACARDTYFFNYPAPPAQLLDVFRCYYGPTMNAYAAAETSGRADNLHSELLELFESHNRSGSADVTSIPATFLRVTVTVN